MNGDTLGQLVATLDDNREVGRLLATIDQANARLRMVLESRETQLRVSARLGGLGAWQLSLAPLHVDMSPEWFRLHDLPDRGGISLSGVLRLIPQPDRSHLVQALRRCATERARADVAIRSRTGSGSLRWMRMMAEPRLDAQGRVVAIDGACQDITAQVAKEAELAAHRQRLEEIVQERTRDLQTFAYALAHDVRAPLAAMAGFAGALSERLDQGDPARIRHYAARIVANAQRAESLLEGILSVIRVLNAPLAPVAVDLGRMAAEILDDLRTAEPERQVEVTIAPGLHARGDPGLLRSLLGNLLSNAWKFTAGREHARIRFDRRADGAFLVQDNGSGFDPAEAGHLFEPLRRLASSLPCEGTGIGLAVALRIALRHGGRMWAEAQPGEGATFFFTLDD